MIGALLHLRSRLCLKSLLSPIQTSSSTIFPSKFPPLSSYVSNSPILERQRQLSNDDDEFREHDAPPRLFVVQPKLRPETHLNSKLEEALNLANSLEQQRDGVYPTEFLDKEEPPHLVVQNPVARSVRADTYFGAGTVDTIKCHVDNLESKEEVDAIFVNAILSGVQQRNLERIWDKPVLDRISLIIEIFNAHAQTKEAKLQAELAALMYKRSRLVRVRGLDGRNTFGGSGESEVVSARGRGSGGRGFISGAGETELQLQRRRISDRRKKLLAEIKEVRSTRATQRASRKRQGGSPGQEMATVAVVGYTNAGKSTLCSALSNSYLYCDDRLFATVDPKLSSVVLPSGRKVLLSDTVGFISDLPVQLVEAFHATLEEVIEADLLVHVMDASSTSIDEHRKAVMQVLSRIGVSKEKLQNMIEVWNKVDLQDKQLDIGELDDEDDASSLPSEDDADNESEQLTNQHDIDQDIEISIDHELADYSDDWLSSDEDQDSWVNYDGLSIGCDTVNVQGNELLGDLGNAAKGSEPQLESTCHVKTSAITGVGLQELLEIIDEKLVSGRVEKKSIFDRKWRPPCDDNNEFAVGQ